MSTRHKNILFGLLGLTGLAATLAATQRAGTSMSPDDLSFFNEIKEVRQIINSRFISEPDEKLMREGAIQGMVEALNDPYTLYVPGEERLEFNKDLTGEYVGIGASVNMQSGWLTIVSPLEDSPAFRAGIIAEDRITAIGGASTENKNINDCVSLLIGEPGTPVVLSVERKDQKLEITVIRNKIKTRSIKGFHRSLTNPGAWDFLLDAPRKIAYIRLTQFTPGCATELAQALDSVGASRGQLNGLILDLRFNPGGLLAEAEQIADLFLTDGIIVSTRGRAYAEKVTRAVAPGTLPNFPIAILLNGSSASASEVLSGALVENNRAIVVGTRSYGKGSVQSVIELPSGDGSELKITEQGYYLPSGRSLSRTDSTPTWGVDPSDGFYVPVTDAQTIAMLEVRRREEVLRHQTETADASNVTVTAPGLPTPVTPTATPTPTPATSPLASPTLTTPPAPPRLTVPENVNWSSPESVAGYLKDIQLAAAVKALQLRIDGGSWLPVGDQTAQPQAIAAAEVTKVNQYQQRLLRELAKTQKRVATIAQGAGITPPPLADLWSNEIDLTGGKLQITDRDGNVISTLDITGNNLERWLIDADIKKPDDTVK